jgi:hypothetical protein
MTFFSGMKTSIALYKENNFFSCELFILSFLSSTLFKYLYIYLLKNIFYTKVGFQYFLAKTKFIFFFLITKHKKMLSSYQLTKHNQKRG